MPFQEFISNDNPSTVVPRFHNKEIILELYSIILATGKAIEGNIRFECSAYG